MHPRSPAASPIKSPTWFLDDDVHSGGMKRAAWQTLATGGGRLASGTGSELDDGAAEAEPETLDSLVEQLHGERKKRADADRALADARKVDRRVHRELVAIRREINVSAWDTRAGGGGGGGGGGIGGGRAAAYPPVPAAAAADLWREMHDDLLDDSVVSPSPSPPLPSFHCAGGTIHAAVRRTGFSSSTRHYAPPH